MSANPLQRVRDRADRENRNMQHWMSGYGQGRGESAREWWTPATDVLVRESGDLAIVMDLPGLRREEIDVNLSGRDLTVSGRKDRHDSTAEYYVRERYCGSFERTVNLPAGIDCDRVSCHFEEGTLEITIRGYAETLEAGTRKLEIRGAKD